jgi:hypothetical protein
MTATALVAKSGSRSFIHVSKTVQSELVPLEDDADGALTGTAQAKFGMCGHVLRQVVDAPVGLPGTRWIELGRFLTGQHQQSSLDVGVVLARRRTLRTILESIEAVPSETMTPQPDRPLSQREVLRDAGVGLTARHPQNDLRTVGILLRTGAGSHATLQLGAFSPDQPDSSSTLLGHLQPCLWSFPLQPAGVGPHEFPTRINQQDVVLACRAPIRFWSRGSA